MVTIVQKLLNTVLKKVPGAANILLPKYIDPMNTAITERVIAILNSPHLKSHFLVIR